MKLLRETIRKILRESSCDGINQTIAMGIETLEQRGFRLRSSYLPSEYDSGYADDFELLVLDEAGDEQARWTAELPYGLGEHECLQAWVCTGAYANELKGTGIGALLYDLAIEIVGEAGMASDRMEVSREAWRMWVYVIKNDDVYEIKGTFDYDAEQTPETDDDCPSWSHEDHEWQRDPMKHPLNQVYVKKDKTRPTIKCLEEKDLIDYGGID